MFMQNEIEKFKKRESILQSQNHKIQQLLDLLEVTKASDPKSKLPQNENVFLQQTIVLIEHEKEKLQEDLKLLSTEEDVLGFLRNKIKIIESQIANQQKQIDQLVIQQKHLEENLIPNWENTNNRNLRYDISGETRLNEARSNLENKLSNLEKKKTKLMLELGLEELGARPVINNQVNSIEEYQGLHTSIVQLEQQRAELLEQLEIVLEKSKKEIADECNLLKEKISEIESEKASIRSTLSNQKTVHPNTENEKLENIFNAFSNIPAIETKKITKTDDGRGYYINKILGLPYCTIL